MKNTFPVGYVPFAPSQIKQSYNEEAKNNRFDGFGVYYHKYDLFMKPSNVVEVHIEALRGITKLFLEAVANSEPYANSYPSDAWWKARKSRVIAVQSRWMDFQAMEGLLSLSKSIWRGDAYNAYTNTEVYNMERRRLAEKQKGIWNLILPNINWLTGETAPALFKNSPTMGFPVSDKVRVEFEKVLDKDALERVLPTLEGVGAHSIEELRAKGYDITGDLYFLLSNVVDLFILDGGAGASLSSKVDDVARGARTGRTGSKLGSVADDALEAGRGSKTPRSGSSAVDEADSVRNGNSRRRSSSADSAEEANSSRKRTTEEPSANAKCGTGGFAPVSYSYNSHSGGGNALYSSFQTLSYNRKQSALEKALGTEVVNDYPVANEQSESEHSFEQVRASNCFYEDINGNEVDGDAIKAQGGEYKIVRRNRGVNRLDWDVNAGSFDGAINKLNEQLGVDLRTSGIDWDYMLEYKRQGVAIDVDDFVYQADDITLKSTTDDSTGVAFDLYREGKKIGTVRYHANGHLPNAADYAANPQKPHFNLDLNTPIKKFGRQKIDIDTIKMHIFYSN